LIFLLDDRRIRIRTSDWWIWIQEAQKHTGPKNLDPEPNSQNIIEVETCLIWCGEEEEEEERVSCMGMESTFICSPSLGFSKARFCSTFNCTPKS
jgi:hypothetical protein